VELTNSGRIATTLTAVIFAAFCFSATLVNLVALVLQDVLVVQVISEMITENAFEDHNAKLIVLKTKFTLHVKERVLELVFNQIISSFHAKTCVTKDALVKKDSSEETTDLVLNSQNVEVR
jgi:hypothetical protein